MMIYSVSRGGKKAAPLPFRAGMGGKGGGGIRKYPKEKGLFFAGGGGDNQHVMNISC